MSLRLLLACCCACGDCRFRNRGRTPQELSPWERRPFLASAASVVDRTVSSTERRYLPEVVYGTASVSHPLPHRSPHRVLLPVPHHLLSHVSPHGADRCGGGSDEDLVRAQQADYGSTFSRWR